MSWLLFLKRARSQAHWMQYVRLGQCLQGKDLCLHGTWWLLRMLHIPFLGPGHYHLGCGYFGGVHLRARRSVCTWTYGRIQDVLEEYQCIHPFWRLEHGPTESRFKHHTMLKVTTFSNEISPALYFCTRISYILIGDEPVGRPRTKGCSGVGAKALILSIYETLSWGRHKGGVELRLLPMMYLAMYADAAYGSSLIMSLILNLEITRLILVL